MKNFNNLFYIGILVISAAFLFFGNHIASQNMFVSDAEGMLIYSATVLEIADRIELFDDFIPDWFMTSKIIFFYAEITSGPMQGQIVVVEQALSYGMMREVATGDRILLIYNDFFGEFWFMDFVRINYIIFLGIAFFVALVLFGKLKGFNSIISLAFICMAIFMVFIPAILSGVNIYLAAAIICVYAIVSTLFIVIGLNKKAFSAILGCLGGVLIAAILMLAMSAIMQLTGMTDHETRNLLNIPTTTPINLSAIIFAGVIIGATGAIMDVAMSISSSLWELRQAKPDATFKQLFKSGLEIGKDILGTMLNTLILAYIGSSLSLIILISASTTTMLELFNRELILVEFLRAMVGGFGMFATIPLTAAICGWLYLNKQKIDRPH